MLDCDVAALYGPRFAGPLAGEPSSAFLADGSEVVVLPGRGFAPQGAKACSLGREPQVGQRFKKSMSPEGATAAHRSGGCRRPFGAWGAGWAPFLGLTPQATCLGSFGALLPSYGAATCAAGASFPRISSSGLSRP